MKIEVKGQTKLKKFSDRYKNFCPDVEICPDYEYLLHFCLSLRILAKIHFFHPVHNVCGPNFNSDILCLELELQRYIDIDIENRYYLPFSNIDIDIDIAILAEKISTCFDILKTAKPDYFGHFDYFLAEFFKEKYRNF